MKILHVITSLLTGGAEKLMVDLLPRLRDLGNEVDLLVFDGQKTPFMEQLETAGIKVKYLGIECNVYNPLFVLKLIPIMKSYDVVHTHNTACQYFVAMANLWVRTRIVTTEHNTNNRRRGKWYWQILDRWMYRQYEKIVCISELTKQKLLEELGKGYWPALVINNGINVKRFHDAEPLAVNTENRYLIVMVAAFRSQKDQDTLVRAMTYLPRNQYELWLVGGDEERKNQVRDLVCALKLESHIKFLGVRMDVPEILKSANVVVLSSHYEGLSLSSVEGMASGKPFIGSDVEGLRDIVDGYGLLFAHGDAQQLATEIAHCCEDNDFAASVGNKCYQRALEFDIEKMANKYNAIYKI